MSFLNDLGGIFHSIGSFITGGDNDNVPQQNNNNQTFVSPQNKGPQAPVQQPTIIQPTQAPLPPSNLINLQQPLQKANPVNPSGPKLFNVNNLPASTLVKAPQFQQPAIPLSSVPSSGIVPDIIHGVEAMGTGVPLGVLRAGEGVAQGVAALPDLGVRGIGAVASKITGQSDANSPIVTQVNRVTNDISDPVNWLAKKTDEAAAAYGPGSESVYKPAQVAANVAAAVPGVESVLTKVGLLNKAGTATDTATALNTTDKAPDEVAVGIKSANPTQGADALTAIQQKEAEASANQAPTEQPVTSSSPPAVNVPPTQSPQIAPPGIEPPQEVAPTSTPEAVPSPATLTPQPTEAIPQTATPTPIETPVNSSSPTNVAQGEPVVNPEVPTAPNAPNVRAALNQHLDDAAKIVGDPTEHDVFGNARLNQAGEQVIAQTPVEELLSKYSGVPDLAKATDASTARAAVMKLAPLVNSSDAELANAARQAMANIGEGLEKGVSQGATTLNYFQSMLDSLPRQAKIPFVITNLDKIRAGGGLSLIKDDLPLQNEVTAKLDNLFAKQEDIKGRVAALEDQANKAALDAVQGTKTDITGLQSQLAKDRMALQAQNGDIVKYYQTLVPGSSVGQKLNALQRTMMLTSPAGRANTGIFAGFNALHQGAQNITQGLLAKAANLVKPGVAVDTLRGGSKVFSGAGRGLVKTGSELKGTEFVDNTQAALRGGNSDKMSNLLSGSKSNFLPKLTKIVKTITHSPSNLTQGVRDQRLYQLATQEGQQKGLSGSLLKQYAEGRSAVATPQMTDNANQLWQSINHMNDNPISKTLNKISSAIGETSPDAAAGIGAKTGHFVMGAIKNQILPFTSFLGGNMWNSLTDKNVVASFVKLLASASKGDLNGVIENFAKTGNNAAYTYALGYLGTKSGIITNTDANGYTDGGAYLHIGSHFIPVNDLGFFGPSIILGNALYQGVNNKGNGVNKFTKTLQASVVNGFKAVGGSSLGTDNSGMQALSTLTGNSRTPGSASNAGAQFAGNFAGQYIPAATSDVNAVLNNYTSLNPTHEAALTKVTKGSEGVNTASGNPSTAKDIGASEVNTLLNKVPFASQALPRNPAVAAPDLEDRLSRGSHVGPIQATAIQQKQDATTQLASDIKNGIPVYKAPTGTKFPTGYSFANTLNTAIQNGNYDKAIQGLQGQLKVLNTPGPEHIPPSTKEAVQDHISQLQAFKSVGANADLINSYGSTTLTQWRAMGDPTNNAYNPTMYQKLYTLDQALANAGVTGGNITTVGKGTTPKFYLPTTSSSSGSSASKAATLVKSNTIGSLPSMARETFINNLAQNPPTLNLPEAKLTAPGALIAPHKITVGTPKA